MKLALGTAQFGLDYGVANTVGKVPLAEITKILEIARSHGIKTLDTAVAYGESERALGEAGIKGFEVISKVPPFPDDRRNMEQWINLTVRDSLERLKQPSIKGILLHRPLQLLEREGERAYEALKNLKQEGLVGKIGASIYSPDELGTLIPEFDFDIIQAPVNILDRRLISSGWIETLKRRGIEVHARSAFLQGLLLMKPHLRPEYFSQWDVLWKRYDAWLNREGITPLQACLAFVLQIGDIDKIVVGVDSVDQLEQVIGMASAPSMLVPEELESSDENLINPAFWKL